MTKPVLFVHGGGAGAYDDDAKLAASLREKLGPSYDVRYPRMPNEADPEYRIWKQTICDELAAMGDGPILVGHSIGASVVIRVLANGDIDQYVAGVFLVAAPFWHDHEIWRWKEVELPKRAGASLPKSLPVFLYHGREDEIVPFSHVELYAKALPQAVVRRLDGRNHQLNDDLSEVASDIGLLV